MSRKRSISEIVALEGIPVTPSESDVREAESQTHEKWNGIDRRKAITAQEEKAFRTNLRRREQDRKDMLIYYAMLGILGAAMFALFSLPFLHQMEVL